MQSETQTLPQNRFLFTDLILSDESTKIWQEECISRITSKNLEKDEPFHQFINWKRTEHEIALFTMYAYADFEIPKPFNCLFELNNPENSVCANFHLKQSIYEGWYPIDRIEHGHKHLCIFKFAEEIPAIINQLYVGRGKFVDVPKGAVKIGICNRDDFVEIKKRQVYVNELRKRYGPEWWKFDEKRTD